MINYSITMRSVNTNLLEINQAKPWDWYLPDYPFVKRWKHYKNISPWKRWRGNLPLKERIRRQLLIWLHVFRGKEFDVYEDSWKKWE